MALFNRSYSPFKVQTSLVVAEGTLVQEYDSDNKVYTPDRRIRPTAIQPVCSIIDPSEKVANGVVNRYITDVRWYENEVKDSNLISPTNSSYKIDSVSNSDSRGRIVVFRNTHFSTPVTLIFTATYVDMVNGKMRRKADFQKSTVLGCNVVALPPIELKTDYPRGRCFNPLTDLKHLKLASDLVVGNSTIPSAHWWYKKNGLVETLITDYVGHNLRELQVPSGDIGNEQHYVCKVQDCRSDLTDKRNAYIDTELAKISGYPRNLIAKQYIRDWNKLQAGLVVEGEDSGGKYLKIPKTQPLYDIFGRLKKDIFQNRISYKENTQYTFVVKGKYIAPESGIIFYIYYKDETYISATLGLSNIVKTSIVKTKANATIDRIAITYANDRESTIYDIQLFEGNLSPNLLEGDTSELTLVGNSTTVYRAFPLNRSYNVGDKFSIRVDNIVSTSPKDQFLFYQKGLSKTVSASVFLSASSKLAVLTLNPDYDRSYPLELYMYVNQSGQSQGNSVTYKNVMLVEGERTAETMPAYSPSWIPAAADIAASAESIQLEAGYRPSVQGKTLDHEFTLVTRMPPYNISLETPYGNDSGIINIPSSVKLFPARIKVDIGGFGTLPNPEKYFSANWGNGLKGMNVLLDADSLGLGADDISPNVVEGLEYARYAANRFTGDHLKLEAFGADTRFVVKTGRVSASVNSNINIRRNKYGFYLTFQNGKITVGLVYDLTAKYFTIPESDTNYCSVLDITLGDSINTAIVLFNGTPCNPVWLSRISTGDDYLASSAGIYIDELEIYSGGTLSHKWDFEGSTKSEQMSDKAPTANKIDLVLSSLGDLSPL